MSFSPKQQGVYRPLLEEAWQRMCQHEGFDPGARCKVFRSSKRCGECRYCEWYRDELRHCVGSESTADLDVKRDFETVMSHFGQIAENLHWMMRADGGDVRRLLHNVHEVCRARNFDEEYMVGVAMKALKREPGTWPGWESLSYAQVGTVLSALKSKARHLRDCKNPSVALLETPGDRELVEEPF